MTSKMTSKLATELNVQVNILIQDAPNDRTTKQSVVTLAPLLAKFALTRLNQAYYYLIQDPDGALLRETFIHPTQFTAETTVEKTIVFAFPTLEEADLNRDGGLNTDYLAVRTPTLEILFRFWALNWCDAVVFLDASQCTDRRTDRGQNQAAQQTVTHEALTTFFQQELAMPPRGRSGGQGFGTVC